MVSSEGLRKAAILVVSLDTETACNLMAHLDKDTLERVTLEIARLEDVTDEERDRAIEEFHTVATARQYAERGGLHYAQELLERTLPVEDAKAIIDQVRTSLETTPFSFLRNATAETLATFLSDEHPQTIALVLSHLLPQQASDLIGSLAPENQLEVTRRIANMEQTSPEIVREVERSLHERLSTVIDEDLEQLGGASAIAEILNHTDRTTEKAILENLESEDPELVEEVRRLMFVFEDVGLVDRQGLGEVLAEIDSDTLCLALKGATQELREKFLTSMSKRAAQGVREHMEVLGAVRVSEVERAQQEIVDVVRRLEEAGAIRLRKRGAEDEELVE